MTNRVSYVCRCTCYAAILLLVVGAAKTTFAWQFSTSMHRAGNGVRPVSSHPRSIATHSVGVQPIPGFARRGWHGHGGRWGHGRPIHRHYPVFHYGHCYRPILTVGPVWGAPFYPSAFRSYGFVGYSRRVFHPYYPVFPAHSFSPAIFCPPTFVPYYPMIGTSLWLGVARPILPARLVLGDGLLLGDSGGVESLLTEELAGLVAARRAELASRVASSRSDDPGFVVRIGASYDAARSLEAGDAAFRAKRYGNATEFYRLAMTRRGGDKSPGHLRAGYALLAQSRYREAHHEFELAMRTLGENGSLAFQLDELYQDESEKVEHLEQLAKASWQKPGESHLQTLIGLFLLHDGQMQRATTFFLAAQRASEGRDTFAARILDRIEPLHVARR